MASTIFMAGIIVFYFYSLNTSEVETTIDKLSYDGDLIASIILSEGTPINWNENDVINPGILTNGKINQTKLENFYDLSLNNYQKTKSLFNTNYEYFIFTSKNNLTIEGEEIAGIGSLPTNQKNLIKISRLTIYNNKLITLNIEIWEI